MTKPASIEAWLAELGQPAADRDYKPGHERMLALLSDITLHNPRFRIRIVGTNGKGSTSCMLAAALQACGYRVGLYTSPHILAFNERIRINDQNIHDDDLQRLLNILMPKARQTGASYFEVATALALMYFSEQQVDIEILEAGVGARLDATTCMPAEMAVITPIAMDHQAWLGDTLTAIAHEKACAMQGCQYAISAPQQSDVISVLKSVNPDVHILSCPQPWPRLAMVGEHQKINASVAFQAIKTFAEISPIDQSTAKHAISQCVVPGRLQHLRIGKANIWLDAAHNRHAIESLLPSLPGLAKPLDAIVVWTRDDRSLADSLSLLHPYTRSLISNDTSPAEQADNIWPTLQRIIGSTPNGNFLVLGSFTTVASILRQLQ